MEKFETVTGIAAVLKESNIDTDQILPAQFLKRITKSGYEDALFFNWRKDPDFSLNREPWSNAKILLAGPDFGTGSSREHAVWAMRDFGFRAVFSPRFGDIFRANAGQQGLLAGVVNEADEQALWAILDSEPETPVTVNLAERTVTAGSLTVSFEIDDYTRWRLMEGHDDISLTLQHEDAIAAHEAKRPAWMPTTTKKGAL